MGAWAWVHARLPRPKGREGAATPPPDSPLFTYPIFSGPNSPAFWYKNVPIDTQEEPPVPEPFRRYKISYMDHKGCPTSTYWFATTGLDAREGFIAGFPKAQILTCEFAPDEDEHFVSGASPIPPPIEATLAEREARYGDFTNRALIAEHFIQMMMTEQGGNIREGWKRMAPYQRQALRVIADKIARILNGDPNYDDNWRDISGYATLVLERLPKA